eukprot:14277624-Alexandrium_andersonii.AAC.1
MPARARSRRRAAETLAGLGPEPSRDSQSAWPDAAPEPPAVAEPPPPGPPELALPAQQRLAAW